MLGLESEGLLGEVAHELGAEVDLDGAWTLAVVLESQVIVSSFFLLAIDEECSKCTSLSEDLFKLKGILRTIAFLEGAYSVA